MLGRKRAEASGGDSSRPSARVVRVLLLVVGAHVAIVLAMKESVFLYVAVVAPLVALLAAIGFDAAVARWLRRRNVMMAGALATLALTASAWAAARAYRERLDERSYSFLPHLLHGELMVAQQLDVARWVDRESMLPSAGTIFGDPTIVSVLALRSGLRVSGELADLNPVWVEGGSIKPDEVVSRIERDGVAAVISPPFGLVNDPYFKSYLFACYAKPRPFFPPQSGPGAGSLHSSWCSTTFQAGFPLFIVTNQAIVNRGMITTHTLEDIHARMLSHIVQHGGFIDDIRG